MTRTRAAVLGAGLAAAAVLLGGCSGTPAPAAPAPGTHDVVGPADPAFSCDQGADGLPVCEGDVPASVGPYRTPDGVLVGG